MKSPLLQGIHFLRSHRVQLTSVLNCLTLKSHVWAADTSKSLYLTFWGTLVLQIFHPYTVFHFEKYVLFPIFQWKCCINSFYHDLVAVDHVSRCSNGEVPLLVLLPSWNSFNILIFHNYIIACMNIYTSEAELDSPHL